MKAKITTGTAKGKTKIYLTRKYIIAQNLKEALKKEPNQPVDDIWAEENTHKEYLMNSYKDLGFRK